MLGDAEQDAVAHRHLFAFRHARYCWDASLSKVVEEFLDDLSDPKSILSGIEEWVLGDRDAATNYALKFLRRCSPTDSVYPIGLFGALVLALQLAPQRALPFAEPILAADSVLARAVWTTICWHLDMNRGGLLDSLDEHRIAELYLTLIKLFPKEDDPTEKSGEVTPRMTVARIRDSIPSVIASRATEIGCSELLRLATLLPKQATWLRWSYRDAVINIRRRLWQSPSPEVVREMLERRGARMLSSDDDLLELVLESLARLQVRLTKQSLPAAEDLWRWEGGGLNRKNFRPKDEEALSDYVCSLAY